MAGARLILGVIQRRVSKERRTLMTTISPRSVIVAAVVWGVVSGVTTSLVDLLIDRLTERSTC